MFILYLDLVECDLLHLHLQVRVSVQPADSLGKYTFISVYPTEYDKNE